MLVDFGHVNSLCVRGQSKDHRDILLIEVGLESSDEVDDKVVLALNHSMAKALLRELCRVVSTVSDEE